MKKRDASYKRCDLCNCIVACRGVAEWEQHIQGIRHRRRAVAQAVTGNPDDLVLSIFEQIPGNVKGYHGRDPALITRPAVHQNILHPQSWAICTVEEQGAAYSDLLKELPNHQGISYSTYHAAARFFSLESLAQASISLNEKLRAMKAFATKRKLTLEPAELGCLAQVISRDVLLENLSLNVPYKPAGYFAAAYTAALCVLLPHLHCHPSLSSLSLIVTRGEYLEITMQSGGRERANPGASEASLVVLWGRVLKALTKLIQARPALKCLSLRTPPNLLPEGPFLSLSVAAADCSICKKLRTEILMGTHAAVGADSPLMLLPVPLIQLILDQALPVGPCQLNWQLQEWLPIEIRSDDSEDDDDDNDDDDDDDDRSVGESDSKSNSNRTSSSSSSSSNEEIHGEDHVSGVGLSNPATSNVNSGSVVNQVVHHDRWNHAHSNPGNSRHPRVSTFPGNTILRGRGTTRASGRGVGSRGNGNIGRGGIEGRGRGRRGGRGQGNSGLPSDVLAVLKFLKE